MLIIYGDYKDMDHTMGFPTCHAETWAGYLSEDMKAEYEFLRPYWENFIEGRCNLVKRRPMDQDLLDSVRICIKHSVFDGNEHTSYAILRPCENADSVWHVLQQCHAKDVTCFIDRNLKILVVETVSEGYGKVPSCLDELKRREYAWTLAYIKRISGETVGILDDSTEFAIKEGFKQTFLEQTSFPGAGTIKPGEETSEEQLDRVAADCAKSLVGDLRKWKEKEVQRWFHETNVSK